MTEMLRPQADFRKRDNFKSSPIDTDLQVVEPRPTKKFHLFSNFQLI